MDITIISLVLRERKKNGNTKKRKEVTLYIGVGAQRIMLINFQRSKPTNYSHVGVFSPMLSLMTNLGLL